MQTGEAIKTGKAVKVVPPRAKINFELITRFDSLCLDAGEEKEVFNGVVEGVALLVVHVSYPFYGLEHYVITSRWTDIFVGRPPCPYIIPPGRLILRVKNNYTDWLCDGSIELYEIRAE